MTVRHAGAAVLPLTADRAGLTTAVSDTLHRDDFTPGHDRDESWSTQRS